ncbi:MAG: hypothetical protein PVG99_06140 [Desulfobacteraceae bacterium]|jgi:hypothetical protein
MSGERSWPLVVLVVGLAFSLAICMSWPGQSYAEEHSGVGKEIVAQSKPYPWKSILVREYTSTHLSPTADVLQVFVDLGREISSEEYDRLAKVVKLMDDSGKVYKPVGRVSGSGVKITQSLDDRVIFSWGADYAYGFLFSVKSRKSNFSLVWEDFPPLDIGNPFKSAYCRP